MIAYTNTPVYISEAIQRASFNTITFVENAVAWVARNYRHNRMVSKLNALDDRMLADIGLERKDIEPLTLKLLR